MMIKKVIDYIKNDSFKIIYTNNTINIINYEEIVNINDNLITIKNNNKILIIKGENIRLNKLLEQEVLITGLVKSIEIG